MNPAERFIEIGRRKYPEAVWSTEESFGQICVGLRIGDRGLAVPVVGYITIGGTMGTHFDIEGNEYDGIGPPYNHQRIEIPDSQFEGIIDMMYARVTA